VYDAQGAAVAVTVVLPAPTMCSNAKTQQSDGYNAVQLGLTTRKNSGSPSRFSVTSRNSPANPLSASKEFRSFSKEVKPGDTVGPTLFAPGDFVDAIG